MQYELYSEYNLPHTGDYHYDNSYYRDKVEYVILSEVGRKTYFKGFLTATKDNTNIKVVINVTSLGDGVNGDASKICGCKNPFLELSAIGTDHDKLFVVNKTGENIFEFKLNKGETFDIYMGGGNGPMGDDPSVSGVKIYIEYIPKITIDPLPESSSLSEVLETNKKISNKMEINYNILKDILISNCIDILPTDKMTDLIDRLSSIETGKKSASGTITSSSTKKVYYYVKEGWREMNYISISNLSFTPRLIYITHNSGSNIYLSLFDIKDTQVYSGGSVKISVYNGNISKVDSYNFKIDSNVVNGIVYDIPVIGEIQNFKWEAYE